MKAQHERLALLGGEPTVVAPMPHFRWPRITEHVREAVLRQLDSSISIADSSGIIARFEKRFAGYHGIEFGLLHSTGTSALLAMYYAAGLQPGDEVICPCYTFPATVSPLAILGAVPVFCDCGPDSNIDPAKIEPLISRRTKAIIVTHMWGRSCEMAQIAKIARSYNLRLFEDCSHAHGARYGGQLVGTFGDAAAWSLQAQKTVAAGEGGILLTNDEELYARAVLLGHSNKRAKKDIATSSPLASFALTGYGLKLRAHPLAVAIADCMLDDLEEVLAERGQAAAELTSRLSGLSCLRLPDDDNRRNSWYSYCFQYAPKEGETTIDLLLDAIHAEGLHEVDRPGSTRPLHREPLFRSPTEVFAWASPTRSLPGSFPAADETYATSLKLPVWNDLDGEHIFSQYCVGLQKVLVNRAELAERAMR
jgi:perosamine synthetase